MKKTLGIVLGVLATGIMTGCAELEQYTRGLGVPFAVTHLYWNSQLASGASQTGVIQRRGMVGGPIYSLVNCPSPQIPDGLALDLVHGRMYWTDGSLGTIRSCTLEGKEPELLVENLQEPAGIAIDFPVAKMYWTERKSGTIKRADYRNGTGVEVLLSGLGEPAGLALALDTDRLPDRIQKMYWTNRSRGTILRANLDGTQMETLVTGLNQPEGIALDLVHGKLYWTEFDRVGMADLAGAHAGYLREHLSFRPYGIALDVSTGDFFCTMRLGSNLLRGNVQTGEAFDETIWLNIIGASPRGIALGIVQP